MLVETDFFYRRSRWSALGNLFFYGSLIKTKGSKTLFTIYYPSKTDQAIGHAHIDAIERIIDRQLLFHFILFRGSEGKRKFPIHFSL